MGFTDRDEEEVAGVAQAHLERFARGRLVLGIALFLKFADRVKLRLCCVPERHPLGALALDPENPLDKEVLTSLTELRADAIWRARSANP